MKYGKFILLLTLVLFVTSCKKQESNITIKEYDADVICKIDYQDNVDDMIINSTNKVYINYNDELLVNKAIYQTTTDVYSFSMYKQIVNLFNDINGISAELYVVDEKLVVEFIYDYKEIDIEEVRDKLGSLLDKEALLNKVDELPISYDEFIDLELSDYDCEVQ